MSTLYKNAAGHLLIRLDIHHDILQGMIPNGNKYILYLY